MDYLTLFRQQPTVALHLGRCWQWQERKGTPFRWEDVRIWPVVLDQYVGMGLLRVAPTAYSFVKRKELIDRAIYREARIGGPVDRSVGFVESLIKLYDGVVEYVESAGAAGTLSTRTGGFGLRDSHPNRDRLTKLFDNLVRDGMLVQQPPGYLVNVDRNPLLREQLSRYLNIDLPSMQARDYHARLEQERRALMARRKEEEIRRRQDEELHIWQHGSIQEVIDRYGTTDHVLAHLIRRHFPHHEIASSAHVGMSRLTRIRKALRLYSEVPPPSRA